MKGDSSLRWNPSEVAEVAPLLSDIVRSALYSDSDRDWDLAVLESCVDYAAARGVFCLREWLTFCGGSVGRVSRWAESMSQLGWLHGVDEPHSCPAQDLFHSAHQQRSWRLWEATEYPLRHAIEDLRSEKRIQREYDQAPITWASSVDRALHLIELSRRPGARGEICILGDDDLTSLAVTALSPRSKVLIVDIDDELVSKIALVAKQHGLIIDARREDLTDPEPSGATFDVVSIDPSPTPDGTRAFVSAAASRVATDGKLLISAFPGHARPNDSICASVREVGHRVCDVHRGAVRYHDAWLSERSAAAKARLEFSASLDFSFAETLLVTELDSSTRHVLPVPNPTRFDGLAGRLWRDTTSQIYGSSRVDLPRGSELKAARRDAR